MARQGFRSDQARELYEEAVRQKWRLLPMKGSGHLYLGCPRQGCFFRMAFSLSGQYRPRELNNQITLMRRHGLTWRGRGGQHTAEKLNRKIKEKI
jgi:hypothetical protein